MDSLYSKLLDERVWTNYLDKIKGKCSLKEFEDTSRFIENKLYLPYIDKIKNGVSFSNPQKAAIGKQGTSKKRIVFKFPFEEVIVLKVVSDLLMDYVDNRFADNTFAFRKNHTPRKALLSLINHKEINEMYSCKTDFHNYFNSIDIDILLPVLKDWLKDEQIIYRFIENILRNDKVVVNGEIVSDTNKGAMAGVPLAGILANIYSNELDWYFKNLNIPYARYSDDIILFCNTQKEIEDNKKIIIDFANSHHLTMNEEKDCFSKPYEPWNYVGFKYENGKISASEDSIHKLFMKIRRLRRRVMRQIKENNWTKDEATAYFIKRVMIKIYRTGFEDNFSWAKWFLPVITTTDNLVPIDRYIEDCARYIYYGKHNKGRYELSYDRICEFGYKPIVASYYKWLENKDVTRL